MKLRKIFLILLIAVFAQKAYPESKNTLRITMRNGFPPLSFMSVEGQPAGLYVDMWKLWAEKTGKKIEFYLADFNTTVDYVKNGTADIHGGLFYSEDRSQWMAFSQPIYELSLCFFFSKRHGGLVTISQLKGQKIGVIGGSYVEDEARKTYTDIEIVPFTALKDMIYAASEGKIRAFLGTPSATSALLSQSGLAGEFESSDERLFGKKVHAGVLKENKELSALIEKGFDAISDKELADIEGRWVPDPGKRYFKEISQSIRLNASERAWLKDHKTVRVGLPTNFPPLSFLGENKKIQGMVPDYFDLLGKRTGIHFELHSVSPSDMKEMLQTRQTDMIPSLVILEPDQFMNVSDPCFSIAWVVVNRTDATFVRNAGDLKGMKVSIVKNHPLYKRVINDFPEIRMDEKDTPSEALKAVSLGESDAFIGSLNVAGYIIYKDRIANLKIAGSAGYEDFPFRFGIRSDYPELTSILNKAVASVTQSDDQEIFRQWMPVRYERSVNWDEILNITAWISGIFFIILGISLYWNKRLAREIDERKRTEEALRQSEEKYRGLIENMNDIVCLADNQGIIAYISPAIETASGYTPDEAIGQPISEFVHPEDLPVLRERLRQLMSGEPTQYTEYRMKNKFGNTFFGTISSRPILKDGSVTGIQSVITNITAKKQAEESLKQSEEQYRKLVENLSDALFMTDAQGYVLYITPAIETIVGLTPEEIIGKNLSEFFHPEDLPLILEKFQKMISGQDAEPSEVRVFHKSGQVVWIRTSSRLHIRNGTIAGLQGLITDITIRKHAEDALKRSNSILKAQQEASIDGILTVDENKRITDYNQRFIELWKFPDDILQSQDDKKLLKHLLSGLKSSDEFMKKIRYLYENILDIGQDEIETTDGRTIDWYCAPILSSENQYLGKIWFFRDISERKRTEQALLDGEEKYRNLIENMSDMVYILDPKGFFVYVSPVSESVTGFGSEELMGRHITEFIHPDDIPILYNQFQRLISGQKAPILEYRMYKKSGELCWGRTSNRLNFKDGVLQNIHGILTDITENKRAEEKIRQILTEQKIVLDYAAIGIAFLKNREFVWLNKYMENMFGYSKEEIIGVRTEQYYPSKESYEELGKNAYPLLIEGKTYQTEQLMKRKDNALFWCSLTGIAVNPENISDGSIWILQDIDHKKHAEQELLKAKAYAEERSQAAETANRFKSEFLANMSHEIRTPMNAIMGFTELLSSLIEDGLQKSYLEAIQSGGKSLLTLINDILDLSKIEAGKLDIRYEPVNPHDIFNEIRQIFEIRLSEKNLEFITDISTDIPESLLMDEVRIRQILINLIGNAVKFTESGYIKISAECNMQNDNFTLCTLHFELEDTGIGVPPEAQANIFEAFMQQEGQSAKKYGGTGLGLAITKRLVEMMNGDIVLESEPGQGSIFRITLYDVEISRTVSETAKLKLTAPENLIFEPATILVADDVDMNRFLIKSLFKNTDIRIIEAENGREAVSAAEQNAPDAILMDISMPVMDGYEATKQIKQSAALKHIPVIALTARAMTQEKEKIMTAGFDGYLTKPIQRAELFDELSRFISYAVKEKMPEIVGANNYSPLPETLEKLPEIITRLENEFQLLWETARESGNFADIENFARQIGDFGKQYSLEKFVSMGKNLLIHVGNFDIDNIESALNLYPKLIEEIRRMKQGG